ncbi:MAG TPA: SpoIIE family protein phosphatase [Thermoanaerobaculia bacterium]|nr:SpoIIE family protein phosphatase [Thermoanaerobaculia bacterium]
MTEPAPGPDSQAWTELLGLYRDEAGEATLPDRLLGLWAREHGATAAGLYLQKDGLLCQEAAIGPGLPESLDEASLDAKPGDAKPGDSEPGPFRSLRFPDGRLVYAPGDNAQSYEDAVGDPLTLLLASLIRSCRLRRDLKDQQFQVNFRVVELENLYDVGLAIAATLDLDRLSEEVLLRAVSLLDARRGALYILEDGDDPSQYRLARTFGGEAALSVDADDPDLFSFLAGSDTSPGLLPGATYLLGLPIAVENKPKGLLVVGDKESRRRDVGPFLPSDRRTLALFANQAAIALENARLHREALERERLEREMHLAAEIQRQILPKGAPYVPGYQLVGWNRPARQVGGDYYDLLALPDGRVELVVGDVSGKGIPAALMVSTLHSALRLLLDQAGFGPSLLERLNRHILESSMANKFITLFMAELEPWSGLLRYLNAGHNPGFLVRPNGRVEELSSSGVPLGLLPNSRYQPRELVVEPGDIVCIYSDGITEAESVDEEEFGTERLIELLRKHQGFTLQEVLETLQGAVTRFARGKPQYDDQTVVLLRRE